jgi:DNA-directed RNA polymerase subunit RPC12/RpoP
MKNKNHYDINGRVYTGETVEWECDYCGYSGKDFRFFDEDDAPDFIECPNCKYGIMYL